MAQDGSFLKAEREISRAKQDGLTSLDLSEMGLFYLPESLGQLTKLESLDLHNNQLRALPESLGQLTKLQSLDLRYNQLTALPESFGQLTKLVALDLNNNQLTALPESFGQLAKLQELELNNNQLRALPESLGQLTKLQSLDLDGNRLTALPESFGQLTKLHRLYLNGNRLTALPESFGQLTKLQMLYLNNNQLTALPESLGQLTKLQWLELDGNRITALPESLGQLTKLQWLFLNGNRLTALPESLGQLTKLQSLDLKNNPLSPELKAACEQGRDALLAYLRTKAEADIVLHEAKLVLVGEGGVGKTSLLGALRGDPWVDARPTTHGVEVEIRPLVLADPDSGTPITLNAWDFGGQAIYRLTHQLFFTAPAVYLVVWEPRRGPDQSCVEPWIEMVQRRTYDPEDPAGRPRILVVATHGGPKERLAHIDEPAFREAFGDRLAGFHHVESKPNAGGQCAGLGVLKEAIGQTAGRIENVGRSVPKSWQDVLDAVRKRSKRDPWISYKKFQALCHRQKVSNDLADLYAAMLNELGHLIHHRGDNDLQNMVILKPEWLSKAISFVLEDSQTKEKNGLVEHARLHLLWNDPERPEQERYPEGVHEVFLKLMEKFDLSYRVVMPEAEAPPTSLIGQLVPGSRPDNWLQAWPAPNPRDSERVQVCRLVDASSGRSAVVEGLLYRLIVRLHRYSLGRSNYHESCHWKSGLILDDAYNGRALLEEVAGDIRVTVRAAYPERFLHQLCEEVQWLVGHFWKGLVCQVCVPCVSPCQGLLEVEELIANKREGIDKIRCSVCKKFHEIDGLLATVAPKPDFHVALATLQGSVDQIRVAQEEEHESQSVQLRTLMSQIDEQFAATMTTLTHPAKDGPRLFSFEPVKPGFWDRPNWIAEKFRLTLWCEHARLPLPLVDGNPKCGVYEWSVNREWVKRSAPFLRALFETLSLVLPIAGAKFPFPEAQRKQFEEQLKFGRNLADAVLKETDETGHRPPARDEPDPEHGDAKYALSALLREFHALLKEVDPKRKFGGLVRVQNKCHKFLWVHEKFKGEY